MISLTHLQMPLKLMCLSFVILCFSFLFWLLGFMFCTLALWNTCSLILSSTVFCLKWIYCFYSSWSLELHSPGDFSSYVDVIIQAERVFSIPLCETRTPGASWMPLLLTTVFLDFAKKKKSHFELEIRSYFLKHDYSPWDNYIYNSCLALSL